MTVAGIVIYEYDRSERKNAIKAEKTALKEAQIKQDLEDRFARIEADILKLQEQIHRIEVRLPI